MQSVVDVALLTSAHDVADARIHREVLALRSLGLTVEVIGLGDPGDGPAGALVRASQRSGAVLRLWRAIRLPTLTQARTVITIDPDVTALAWLHRELRPRSRRRLVADVHEDYLAVLQDRPWARGPMATLGALWARWGAWAAQRADLTVVADSHLLRHVPDRVVLTNQPDLSLLPEPSEPDEAPRAIYIGDIRASRGLDAMIDTMRLAPSWSLDLVGRVSTRDGKQLLDDVAADPLLRDRVRVHGQLPPTRAWQLARGAWVGLLMLEATPAFQDAVPSKLYEYTACGLAVLATPLPRTLELLTKWGNGVAVDSGAAAAVALESWSSHPEHLKPLREAARARRATLSTRPADLVAFAHRVAGLVAKTQD